MTSYAADNLVMSQAGLGLRVAYFRLRGVPLATAASAQAMEKALEALGLALAAGPFLWMPGEARLAAPTVIWVTAGGGVGLVHGDGRAATHRQPRGAEPGPAATALKRPGAALEIVALTLGWVARGADGDGRVGGDAPPRPCISRPALVLLAVNMAALVPGLPANVGTFEVSCSWRSARWG